MTAKYATARREQRGGLTVQGWFLIVFALIAALVIGAAVLIARTLGSNRDISGQLISAVLPAQAQAYRLQAALLDQETGVRGYGITGNPQFLQPYQSGRVAERQSVAGLRQMVGSLPRLNADVTAIERAAATWRADYAEPLIALAAKGPLTSADLARLTASKASFDHLRSLFRVQIHDLAQAQSRDQARLRTVQSATNWLYTGILAGLLLAAGVLAFMLHGAVVRPLNRLRGASRHIASGDFSYSIPQVGPADIRAVAADVEGMRQELVTALEDARAAEKIAARQATDLDQYATELARSNAELEQFAYVASHDLQEPLRKVASFCQLLAQRYEDQLDDRGRQYIDFAVDGAHRMQALITDLLALSRVGRADRPRLPVRLGRALDLALAELAPAITEAGAVIERPDELPTVQGDLTLLALVWQNLIGNAIKFTEPGVAPRIQVVSSEPTPGKWTICVADNGIGIPPEFSSKIFVIFQRLHTREAYSGTGIGLALCKRIIEHHGGDICLDTSYSGGTRICFTLPASSAEEPEPVSDDVNPEGISA